MKQWEKVTDRIVCRGSVYSTNDFQPNAEDIREILEIATSEEVRIAHLGKNIMLFRGGRFCVSENYFENPDAPRFATRQVKKMLDAVDDNFTRQEVKDALYPESYLNDSTPESYVIRKAKDGGFIEDDGFGRWKKVSA